jgi:hypothetical protein
VRFEFSLNSQFSTPLRLNDYEDHTQSQTSSSNPSTKRTLFLTKMPPPSSPRDQDSNIIQRSFSQIPNTICFPNLRKFMDSPGKQSVHARNNPKYVQFLPSRDTAFRAQRSRISLSFAVQLVEYGKNSSIAEVLRKPGCSSSIWAKVWSRSFVRKAARTPCS